MRVRSRELSKKQRDALQRTMELDLVAAFREMEAEARRILARGVREGKTADEIIGEITALLEPDGEVGDAEGTS